MPWNDENVSRLRDLWDQGLPTAQIGKLIGFTKNAVVGKAHRIGLERRPSPIRRTAVKPDRKKARSPVIPKLNFEDKSVEQKEVGTFTTIFHPRQKKIYFLIKQKEVVNGQKDTLMNLSFISVTKKGLRISPTV